MKLAQFRVEFWLFWTR